MHGLSGDQCTSARKTAIGEQHHLAAPCGHGRSCTPAYGGHAHASRNRAWAALNMATPPRHKIPMRQTVSALAGATSLGAVGEEGPPDDCCPVGLGRGPEPGRLLAARPSQAFCESRATIWVAGVRDDLGGGEWGRAHFRERPTSESGQLRWPAMRMDKGSQLQ